MKKEKKPEKLKTYLNREERCDVITLSGIAAHVKRRMLDIWGATTGLSKLEKKYLRMGVAFIDKATVMIVQRLDPEFAHRVVADANSTDVLIGPASKVDLKRKEMNEAMSKVVCSYDDIVMLAETALEQCVNCGKRDYAECRLRKACMDLLIPAYDEYATGYCQYNIIKMEVSA